MKFCNFDFAVSGLLARSMSEQELDDTILHEMIHYYILSNQMQDNSAHGILFRKEMERINCAFRRHITISRRYTDEELKDGLNDSRRMNVVAVIRLADNRWGMMVAARTRVQQLWNQLEHVSEVKQVLWFISDNSFFNKFPRRSTLKFHPMEVSDLLDKLNGARVLVRKRESIMVNGCDIQKLIG